MNTPQPEAPVTAGAVNPGDLLRRARESRGLGLPVVSLQLNIPERVLQQIEAGEFSKLPGNAFARGYVRNYASLLGLDPAQLIAAFDRYTGTCAGSSQIHALGTIEEPLRLASVGLRLFTFVLLALLAGSAFLVWQESRQNSPARTSSLVPGRIEVEGADGTTQVHSLDTPEEPATAVAGPATPVPVPVQATAPVLAAAPVATGPDGEKTPPVPLQPAVIAPQATPAEPVVGSTAPAAVPDTGEDVATAGQGEARLELKFTADCWLRVVDADRRVLLNALVRAGEIRSLQGRPPVSLRIGYARGLQLSYNGQPVDLKPYIRGETASLKLGQ